jgi:membrane AbrB-like protein
MTRDEYRRLAYTVALGAIGGLVWSWLHLPLPWMVGPLLAATIGAVSGVPVLIPARLRDWQNAVLGVLLGCSFTPSIFDHASAWSLSLAGLLGYLAVSIGVLYLVMRRCGYDPATSFFAAAPGGIYEMVSAGAARGGDARTLTLSHSVRVVLVALAIPLYFAWTEGYSSGAVVAKVSATNWYEYGYWRDLGMLLSSAVLGSTIARRLRLPVPELIGSMAFSALVHATGLTAASPPWLLVVIAQLIVGASLGMRFLGVEPKTIFKIAVVSLPLTALQLGITGLFVFGLHWLTGLPVMMLILAFSPGGLAEMSLIALFLGADPTFVAAHHLLRVTLIIISAALVFDGGLFLVRKFGGSNAR